MGDWYWKFSAFVSQTVAMEIKSPTWLIMRRLLSVTHITQLFPLAFTFGTPFITLHVLHNACNKRSLRGEPAEDFLHPCDEKWLWGPSPVWVIWIHACWNATLAGNLSILLHWVLRWVLNHQYIIASLSSELQEWSMNIFQPLKQLTHYHMHHLQLILGGLWIRLLKYILLLQHYISLNLHWYFCSFLQNCQLLTNNFRKLCMATPLSF